MKKHFIILVICLILACGFFSFSATTIYAENNSMEVSIKGSAEIEVMPNEAEITISVNLKEHNSEELQNKLSGIYQNISEALKQLDADLRISNKNLSIYEISCDELKGYQGYLTFYTKTTNLSLCDEISKIGLNNGATSVYFNNYNLTNREEVYKQALNLAIEQAKNKMMSINSNYKIKEIKEENIYDYYNFGQMQVRAQVEVIFETY